MFTMEFGRKCEMMINYDSKSDLLYIRFDGKNQPVVNKRIDDDIVLDMGENDHIVGIEIMAASEHVQLNNLLPIEYSVSKAS